MRSRPGRRGGAVLAVALLGVLTATPSAASPTVARDTTEACEVADPSAFADRPGGETGDAVDCVAFYGVTRGVTPDEYRPTAAVSRGQMASFLVRTAAVADAPLPPATVDRFPDHAGTHEDAVNRLAAAGIAAGAADFHFHPDQPVSRAQMASFVARLIEHVAGERLPEPTVDHFIDDDGTHERRIDQLAGAPLAIVQGVGDDRYDPDRAVTRGQMALFIARTLDHLTEDRAAALARVGVISALPGPELVDAAMPATTSPDEAVVAFTFDTALAPTVVAARFLVYGFDAVPTAATAAKVDPGDRRTVLATFDRHAARLATTAAVTRHAVQSTTFELSPEGSAPLRTLVVAGGATAAPDLISITRLGARAVDFNFDEPAWRVDPGSPSGYHLVLDDGTVKNSTMVTGDGHRTHTVDFDLSDEEATRVARGYVDAGVVRDDGDGDGSGGEPVANPRQAVDVNGGGTIAGRPDLEAIILDPSTDSALFRFDEAAAIGTGELRLYTLLADEHAAVGVESVDGRTVRARFAEHAVSTLVTGGSAGDRAVVSPATGLGNRVDEVGLPLRQDAGRTVAPDLVRAGRVQRPVPDSQSSERLLVLTFDESLVAGDLGRIAVYDAAGRRTSLDPCTAAADRPEVVCGADSVTEPVEYAAIGAARYVGVEHGAVRHPSGNVSSPASGIAL